MKKNADRSSVKIFIGNQDRRSSSKSEVLCMDAIWYTSVVRSQLEYSTIIWNPYYAAHVSAIERVQHKFLRIINHKLGMNISDLDYNAIMSLLNLQSLEARRNFFDITFLSKLVNSKIDCAVLLGMINLRLPMHKKNHVK